LSDQERWDAALLLLDLASQLGREMRQHLEPELRKQGLVSPLELRVCGAIDDLGPQRPIDLARLLHLPISTVSELSDRLVQAGLLLRERNPQDRRSVVLAPTVKTHQAVQALRRAAAGWLADVLGRLDEETLHDLLQGLRRTAEQLPGDGERSCGGSEG